MVSPEAFRIGLQGDLGARSEDLTITDLSSLRSAALNLGGRIESGDGAALISLLNLGDVFAVDKRAGRIDLTARGPLDGDLALDGRIVGGGLDVVAKGKVRLAGNEGPTAALALKIANARLARAYNIASDRAPENVPIALTTQLSITGSTLDLNELAGKVAGTEINGRLHVGLVSPTSVTGDLAVGTVYLPAFVNAAIGAPPPASSGRGWSPEPFDTGVWSNHGHR